MKRSGSAVVSPVPHKVMKVKSLDVCNLGCEDGTPLIHTLADEMLTLIFSFLRPVDICNSVAQVCPRWKNLHLDPAVYRVCEFTDNTECIHNKLQYLMHAPWLVSLTLKNQVETTTILETVSENNNRLESLTMKCCRGSLDREKIIVKILKTLIRKCPLLHELKVKDCKGFTTSFYTQVGRRLPRLRKVHFILTPDFGSEALVSLAENCPHLEEIRACHKFTGIAEAATTDADIELLIKKLGGTIKRLELNGVIWSEMTYIKLGTCTNITDLSIRFAVQLNDAGLIALSRLPNLRRLDLAMSLRISEETWIRVLKESPLRNLRQLSLVITSISNNVAMEIGRNLKYLEKISLGCMRLGPSGVNGVVKGCTRLRSLELLFVEGNMARSLTLIPANLPRLKKLSIVTPQNELNDALDAIRMRMPKLEIKRGDPRWIDFFTSILEATEDD